MRYSRRIRVGLKLAALLLTMRAGSAHATLNLLDIDGSPLTLSATAQNREEVWNWFTPSDQSLTNRYHFLGSWIRVGAGYELEGVKARAELMAPYFFNLPDNASAAAPQGALGLGAAYYKPHGNPNDASVFLKQGFLEFGQQLLSGLNIKGGRFEFSEGSEFMPAELDPELKWLATNRVAQRLIGNFGFSDVMRSFDGAAASYGDNRWQAMVVYGAPTKGSFDLNGMDEVGHTDLVYASLNALPGAFEADLPGAAMARLFYIYYNDSRGLPLVDNRGLSGKLSDRSPVSIDTIGGDYVLVVPAGPGQADAMLWSAFQFGAWGALNQKAYAVVGEAGYRLIKTAGQPWLRIGYTVSSGDGDSKDQTHSTFFQSLPTPRLYAMFPFFNMMNLNDAMAQLVLNPLKTVELQSSLHGLWLDSHHDLWYSGGGAFDNRNFGYAGRPVFGHGYLASLLDLQVTWKASSHAAVQLYYGHAFGGSVIGSIYPQGREADYGFIQTNFSL